MKRIFLIVLDSVGAGELPDAAKFGDKGANTLKSVSSSSFLLIPNLIKLGIGNINGLGFLGKTDNSVAAYGKLAEMSNGKDTTTGHWEIAGLISEKPMPTYPAGFPGYIIDTFEKETGRGTLCNKPYSGTEVIKDYGQEHIKSGKLIVYTSADSVFQIAAHDSVVSKDELYDYCLIVRKILSGSDSVGRVIARPFTGTYPNFERTENRRDFSLAPPGKTMLDYIKDSGFDTIAVGKINDIFAGHGITKAVEAHDNLQGMAATERLASSDFTGLCFTNLVDFDSKYGHRNNIDGYAKALSEFDEWLGSFIPIMHNDDMLIITADHGCDPGDISTDHTREYVPLLVYGKNIKPCDLGILPTYSDIAKTITHILKTKSTENGVSFAEKIL